MSKTRFVSEFRPPGFVMLIIVLLALMGTTASAAVSTSRPLPDSPSVNNHEGGQPAIGTQTDALFMSVSLKAQAVAIDDNELLLPGSHPGNAQIFCSLSSSAATNFNNDSLKSGMTTTPDPGGSIHVTWRDHDQANVISRQRESPDMVAVNQAALPADTPNCAVNKARADANSPATHHLLE